MGPEGERHHPGEVRVQRTGNISCGESWIWEAPPGKGGNIWMAIWKLPGKWKSGMAWAHKAWEDLAPPEWRCWQMPRLQL